MGLEPRAQRVFCCPSTGEVPLSKEPNPQNTQMGTCHLDSPSCLSRGSLIVTNFDHFATYSASAIL